MQSLKLLIFDISSEYGHFRKFNTTSSPLTYAVPTRTALAGLLGAILGIEREITPNVFPEGVTPVNELFDKTNADLAIQVLSPIKKVNIGFNLLDTGKSPSSFFNIENRTQIEFELLKHPKFRIYFSHKDEVVFNELVERIKNVRHHFTPYLGLAQFTSTVEWVGEEEVQLETAKEAYSDIQSIVNLSAITDNNPVQFEENNKVNSFFYTTDTMPTSMQRDRIVTDYAEILVERHGKTIKIKTDNFYKTSYGNILFL